jgi:hypothetical protein
LLKDDPHRLVPPSLKGLLYRRRHPEEVEALRDATEDSPLGWGSDADWTSTIQVPELSALRSSELYSNEFVPGGADDATVR